MPKGYGSNKSESKSIYVLILSCIARYFYCSKKSMEMSMEHFLDVIGIFVYHIQLLALLLTSMVALMMILARVML